MPVRIWHGVRDQVVPVGMGRYIARAVPGRGGDVLSPTRRTTSSTTAGARSSASSWPRRGPGAPWPGSVRDQPVALPLGPSVRGPDGAFRPGVVGVLSESAPPA